MIKSNAKWLRYLRILVITAGVPTLIYWASREQALDWRQGLNLKLAAGLVLSQLAIACYSLRFRSSLRIAQIELSFIDTLRINTLSMFYQFFVPMSVGGDLTKLVKLKGRQHGAVASVSGIVLDHFIGLLTLMLISFGLMVWRRPIELDLNIGSLVALTLIAMITGGVVVVRYVHRRKFNSRELLHYLTQARWVLLQALIFAFMMQTTMAAAIYVGSLGWQFELDYFDIAFVMTTSLMFSAIPVNLGGIGMTEVAGTGLYLAMGLPMPAAVLLVSLLYVYRLVGAIGGGLWDLAADVAPPRAN